MKRPRLWWTSVKGGRRAQRRPFKYTRDEMPDTPKRVLKARALADGNERPDA